MAAIRMPRTIDRVMFFRQGGNGARLRGTPQQSRSRSSQRLVIVGNGPVSHKFCERLDAIGGLRHFELTIFGEESRAAYNRLQLTRCFDVAPEHLIMAPDHWYEERQIQLFMGDPIIAIDREKRIVRSEKGHQAGYDKLVLATGSRPFVPPIEGTRLPGVFVYRTVDDILAIRRYAGYCRRAAVLGGGLLGLEAANAIKRLGIETWVVERGSSLMARQLDPEASALLQRHVESLGLHICTALDTERIEAIGPDRLLHFRSGEQLRVQMVVIAVGVRPRTELAAAAGLEVHPKGGVVVDDFLQTTDPRISAIGECASHRGTFYGLAAPGYQMAADLASSLCGRRRKFLGNDQSTWLKLPGISVATLGDFQGGANHLVSRSESSYRRIAVSDDRLVGAIAVGDWSEQARVQELIERRGRLWRWQRARFTKTGNLWRGAGEAPVAQWPANAIICNCMGIRRGALSAACAQGCTTADQLAKSTGASTVCGSCRPLLEQLTGALPSRLTIPGTKALLIAALSSVALVSLIAFLPPIPFANSVQEKWRFDALAGSSLFRQISGFTLVGLALLSMVLSIRKRVRRFKWGEVGIWRAIHAALGALTLVMLVTHTGFRLGHNLNFVLMANFIALAGIGGLAGAVNALEARLPAQAARRMRALWTGAHIALAWPLPVLVLFHVLVSYKF